MNNSQTYFITGGTGNQGGAVLYALLKKGYGIKALCRNPVSAEAQSLSAAGVEIVEGDLNDPESYIHHLEGNRGIFSVQALNKNTQQEVDQGSQLVDTAKKAGTPHFVYSSVSGADQGTDIPHFKSKHLIEQHLKESGISHTIIRPVVFCENLLNPKVKNSILKGKLIMPLNKETTQQYISMHDIGVIASSILENKEAYENQTLTIATDQVSMAELTELFSEVLNQKMKYQKLPGLITRLSMGKDLTKMFKWMDQNDFVFVDDIEGFKSNFPGLIDMKTWIKRNF